MEYKIGDIIKRPYWVTWGTVVDTQPGQVKLKGHVKNHPEAALWYNVDGVGWEKQDPKVAKIGDVVTGPAGTAWKYVIYDVEGPSLVRLSRENGAVKLGTWFELRNEPLWSINGVPCQEFFGNAAQKQPVTAPPPVDVPKRKKRVYNA